MADPRESVIDLRLEGVRRILAVTGGKGGIGKSFVAASTALALADAGRITRRGVRSRMLMTPMSM